MTLTIHLGVLDIPYAEGAKTTGDVADILEEKYHVMEHFWEMHQGKIVDALTDSVKGALESMMMGGPRDSDPNAAGASEVERMFRDFLSNKEMDSLGYPGIPTAASLAGVSHRFKRPYKRRPPRPSFIDTGQYEASMKVWVDG